MELSTARGIILEEVVTKLLEKVGYRPIVAGQEGTMPGKSGLEVQGRGYTHQIDCLGAFDYTPAFVYPMRIMVEAKCYSPTNKIGIEVVRNSLGVLKDISENYFFQETKENNFIRIARYNYFSAIFSTSGFTAGAENYGVAHQIYLIQYKYNRLFEPITNYLLAIKKSHLKNNRFTKSALQFREQIRNYLEGRDDANLRSIFARSAEINMQGIATQLDAIGGSYIGMLNGMWPIHLLSKKPLSGAAFAGRDVINCKVYGRESKTWSFVPMNSNENDADWFRLEFDLPEGIAKLVNEANGDKAAIATIKHEQFSFINVSGIIDGVRRQIRLEVDEEWIARLIQRNTP